MLLAGRFSAPHVSRHGKYQTPPIFSFTPPVHLSLPAGVPYSPPWRWLSDQDGADERCAEWARKACEGRIAGAGTCPVRA